jgi:hypothetical protein
MPGRTTLLRNVIVVTLFDPVAPEDVTGSPLRWLPIPTHRVTLSNRRPTSR